MNCEPIYYSGLGDCDALFKRVVGFLILDKKTTISDETLLATWQVIIADIGVAQTGIYLPISRGYQNNTAEPERVTSNLGITEKADDPNVALVGFLKGSYCDYKTLYAFDGKDVDFVAVLDNGQLWLTKNSDGDSLGFRANFTIAKNAPKGDNVTEGTPLYIDFLYKDEMNNGFVSTPAFNTRELRDVVPVGLSMTVAVAWAASDVTLKIVKRCAPSQPYVYASATVSNFPILAATSDVNPSFSAVDDTNKAIGIYVLTTTAVVVTDDLLIRAQDDDGSNQTHVSPPVTIVI